MNTLIIRTTDKIIYLANNKVTLVKSATTGRFMKVCPMLRFQVKRFLSAMIQNIFHTAKFTDFTKTVNLKKLVNAAATTLKLVMIEGMAFAKYILQANKEVRQFASGATDTL